METGGVRWTGLDAVPDICHFPDSSKLELDDWQGYCQGVTMDTSQVFQTDGLADTWSTTQPCDTVSDSNVMPGLSTLDQLSSFEVFPPPLSDGMNTSEDASTALPDVYEAPSTQWTGDTFSYFYGSEYNPFGCAFHEMCQDTVNENQSPECTTETVERSKPSYSEIAKSTLSTKTSEECLVSQSMSMPVGERLPSKSSSQAVRHVPFDPVTINPNSAYGLDSFATPRLVHKDRCVNTGSRCSVDSFVTAKLACKDRCVNAYSQHSVDSFVTPRPVHKDKRVNTATSSYGLDSFDIPLRGSKHRCSASSTRSSSSESCRPRVDSVTESFNEDHSDVSGFFQPPSINTHCRKTQASDRRQKVDTSTSVSTSVFSMTGDAEMGEKAPNRDMHDDAETFDTAQTITATLNGMRRTAEDSKLSSSRSRAKVSADSNRQSANGDESMHVPNNSKPISSNDGAFRPKSVDRVNNNLRDNSKGKDRARNNNVRNDSKVSDRTHSNKVRNDSKVSDRTRNNNMTDDSEVSDRTHNNNVRDDSKVSDRTCNNSVRDNSKVSDRTHNNNVRDDSKVSDRTCNNNVRDDSKVSDRTRNNNMTDDSKVSDRTHSSRGHGRQKASEGATVVKTKVDYLEPLEHLHDVCTRAGQHLLQLLCKSLLIVLCVLLLVIKGLVSLTLNLFVYIVLFYQDWLKQQQRSYTQPTRTRRNSTHLPRSGYIQLPTTGEEAVRRLLSCDVKNPYSVLGVGVDASDEEIKRFYRRQAILVHPDKNHQVRSEEAFKILQNAFDIIGDPEKRQESRRMQEAEERRSEEAEARMQDFVDEVTQWREQMKEAANNLICDMCGGTHLRIATDRTRNSARYCSSCWKYHPAKENDLWAEDGFLFCYYACMEGVIYDVTAWASCQGKLRRLQPNLHTVRAHLMTRHRHQHKARKDNLDDFLRHFGSASFNQGSSFDDPDFPSNTWKPKAKKRRRKRKN